MSEQKHSDTGINTIEEALDALRSGEMIIVVDDEDRENEGDLVMAAEKVTPQAVNFIAKHGRGLICLAARGERLRELDIQPMVARNTASLGTNFTVSIDAATGVTTGISAADRARTVEVFINQKSRPSDLARPGHIFPLEAQPGGVLRRAGHTEAVVDLCEAAGLYPAGLLCEIMDDDGDMARMPRLHEMAREFDLKLITIADLISWRRNNEQLVNREAEVPLPTDFGEFRMIAYSTPVETVTLAQQADLLADGHRCVEIVAGDHHRPDAGMAGRGNGRGHLGAGGIDHAQETDEGEIYL